MSDDLKTILCNQDFIQPVLDPGFVPAALWNKRFREMVSQSDGQDRDSIPASSRKHMLLLR